MVAVNFMGARRRNCGTGAAWAVMHTVDQYRKPARERREIAKRVDQSEDRRTLEQLSKAWETLASLRERDMKAER